MHDRVDTSAALPEAVSLEELDRAQLHDRVETKLMLSVDDIPAAIEELASAYYILDHCMQRRQVYHNDYFDNAGRQSYHEHHNQNGRRFKVRYRSYENSDVTFFEIKRSEHGRTVKDRRLSHRPNGELGVNDAQFLVEQTGLDPASLSPSLTVRYQRILLVRHDFLERVTLDFALSFNTGQKSAQIPGLAICEIKQPKLDLRSPVMQTLRRRPQSFSKYCIGLAMCHPELRRNRFKKIFLGLAALPATPIITRCSP